MDTVIYLLHCIAYLVLFIIGLRLAKRNGWWKIGNVLLIVIFALLYDNGILALGKYVGEGDRLKTLNEARYWMHALFTPLLVLFAWDTLKKANLEWAKNKLFQGLVLLFTLSLIIIELVTVTWDISLEPSWKYGILSYKKGGGHGAPPIMIMGVSLSLLITSIIIWWKQKWPWFFLGLLFMGVPAIGHFFLETNALHNISELILMIALLATNKHGDGSAAS